MSSPSSDTEESSHPIRPSLALESLDAEGLWLALGNVEKALPHLLLCLKPILSRLTTLTGADSLSGEGSGSLGKTHRISEEIGIGEKSGEEGAIDGIKDYMAILDDIQYVLRQTTFYLKATKTSPLTLTPPNPSSIPTPLSSTLPTPDQQDDGIGGSREANGGIGHAQKAELGLYASRLELKTLGALQSGIRDLKRELMQEKMGRLPGEARVETADGKDEIQVELMRS